MIYFFRVLIQAFSMSLLSLLVQCFVSMARKNSDCIFNMNAVTRDAYHVHKAKPSHLALPG